MTDMNWWVAPAVAFGVLGLLFGFALGLLLGHRRCINWIRRMER